MTMTTMTTKRIGLFTLGFSLLAIAACSTAPDAPTEGGDETIGTVRQAQDNGEGPIRANPGCRTKCEDMVGLPCIKQCPGSGDPNCGQKCVDKTNDCIRTCNIVGLRPNDTIGGSEPPPDDDFSDRVGP
jgi:hypothetical protein